MEYVRLSQRILAKELRFFEKKAKKIYFTRKNKLFSKIKSDSKVLEIGPGTGVNFIHYPKKIFLNVIEPNSLFREDLMNKANKFGFKFNFILGSSERLPFKNDTFDFVVSTLVLCSVKDLEKSLKEIKRVLKNEGKFIFVEHVIDKKNRLRKSIQDIATYFPCRFFGDGCRPNRDIGKTIKRVFSNVKINNYYQTGLGFFGYIIKSHISGVAVKSERFK